MAGRAGLIVCGVACVVLVGSAQQAPQSPAQPAPPATPATAAAGAGRSTHLGNDPSGNPLRFALKTGHVSNYDESKVAAYTLPDPLVTNGGAAVRDARGWAAR